jgi:diacylglycerol O-acyltransferase
MELISPLDSMFLLGESREHPMHVGGLQLFEPPKGAGGDFLRDLYQDVIERDDIAPTFRKHPAELFGGIANLTWAFDRDLDLEYHLRRSALPSPGRVRELLELTSRLHGSLLDRHRPLWESHLVEGLNDGRFAVYTKIHHALVDGVSAMRMMRRALSTDPEDHEARVVWALNGRPSGKGGKAKSAVSRLNGLTGMAESVLGLGPSVLHLANKGLFQQQLTLPVGAPRTIFNVPIGGARRCAAQSWPIERVMAIKRAAGVTLNDVVLAMCGGALRAYLIEQKALPDRPLIAMVPVSLREESSSSGGNQVGALLASLATHREDPAQRLAEVSASMRSNKAVFKELPKLQQVALSAFNVSPLLLSLVSPALGSAAPPFNLVISNVPGSREPLYWNGARLDGNYPLSIALDGQALNITLSNNADNLDFGLVGCRRSVPSLQRLLGHLEDSLSDLEQAVGTAGAKTAAPRRRKAAASPSRAAKDR